MNLRLSVVVALSVGLVGSSGQRAVFRGGTDAVIVDVSVHQKRRPVLGLRATDFELLDNGRRQDLLDVSVETVLLEVLLLQDRSASLSAETLARIKEATPRIARGLKADDRLHVLGFGSRLIPVSGRASDPAEPATVEDQTSLFDSVLAATMRRPDPERRRLLIAITDGIDTTSAVPYSIRSAVLDRSDAVIDVVAIADERYAMRYKALWLPVLPPDRQRLFRASESGIPWVVFDMVERSGGELFDVRAGEDFVPALLRSIDGFRQRYVLRYRPMDGSSAGWHELAVRVPGKKYEVRHRRGYWRAQ